MSERNAQDANNDCVNNNDFIENTIQNNENVRKRKSKMQCEQIAKQQKNNYWAILDNDANCDQECLKIFEKHVQEHEQPTTSSRAISNNTTSNENNNDKENTNNNNQSKINQNNNTKIPPLNIFDVEPNELIKFIRDELKINKFKIKECNNKKISLFMLSMDNYVRVKAYLEKSKTKFFTYTPKDVKTKTYLLKGLCANIDENEILNELFQNANLKLVKITPFTTKKSISEKYSLPIYLVQITKESKVSELKSIKCILYRCVHWKNLRKPEIPQCRNCQSFFHSASNCFLPHRCVKCNEKHEIGKCSLQNIPANEKEKLYCVLCKKYGHPASYKGCERYKELQQKLRSKKQELSQMRKNNTSIPISSNLNFANVVKDNNLQNVNNTNSIQNVLEKLNHSMQNLSNQIINLNKQLQLQVARIDTIFSILEA